MNLKVPFYKQSTSLNCGPTVLRMVLAYFDKDYGIKFLEEKVNRFKRKGVSTIKLAIASIRLGFKTEFFSKHILFNEENLKLDFYKEYNDINQEESKKLLEEAKNIGINIQKKSLTLKKLLSKITEDSVPIVLVDWNILLKEKGYHGHFVPVVGYDRKCIYIHNSRAEDFKGFMSIKKEIFDKMRKAKGTDEDIIVIYRKVNL